MAIVLPALTGGAIGIIKAESGKVQNRDTSKPEGPRLTLQTANGWNVLADFQTEPQHIIPPETGNGFLKQTGK